MSDVFDQQRLVVDRVRAAGHHVRRVTWTPGVSIGVTYLLGPDSPVWLEVDEEMAFALTDRPAQFVEWLDFEIARARRRFEVARETKT